MEAGREDGDGVIGEAGMWYGGYGKDSSRAGARGRIGETARVGGSRFEVRRGGRELGRAVAEAMNRQGNRQ